MKNKILSILFLITLGSTSNSQSITKATMGSIGGQFKNGNIILSYTLGEVFVGAQSNSNVQLGTGFWSVVPAGYSSSAVTIYRFVGNGNFSNSANWQNNQAPPNPLPAGTEVIIDPSGNGQCMLDISFQLSPGAKLTVMPGAKFVVPGNLNLQ